MAIRNFVYLGLVGSAFVFAATAAVLSLSGYAPWSADPPPSTSTLHNTAAQNDTPTTLAPGLNRQVIRPGRSRPDAIDSNGTTATTDTTGRIAGRALASNDRTGLSQTQTTPVMPDPPDITTQDTSNSSSGGLTIFGVDGGGSAIGGGSSSSSGGNGGSGGSGGSGGGGGGGGSGGGGGGAAPNAGAPVPTQTAAAPDEDAEDAGPTGPEHISAIPSGEKDEVAFPGATGYGAYATGGRGGDVYAVTTLNDSEAGSLRYGIQSADGPRTIIFNISGTIYLNSPLIIDQPNLTLAGQTAPGNGITLAGQPVMIKNTEHIIVRHLRVRVGDINAADREPTVFNNTIVPGKPENGLGNLAGEEADALRIYKSTQVIVDHLSLGWSMDEIVDIYQSDFVTVQNCLIANSLDDSYHPKGAHGYGVLIVGGNNEPNRISFVRNILAHNRARNPGFSAAQDANSGPSRLSLELINNIVYNWKTHASHKTTSEGIPVSANIIGNLYIPGPDTMPENRHTFGLLKDAGIYLSNNQYRRADDTWERLSDKLKKHDDPALTPRHLFPTSEFITKDNLLFWLSAHAGSFLNRDSIDTSVISSMDQGLGTIIDSQDDLGGFPVLVQVNSDTVDTDYDGLPNAWEQEQGLDPNDANDAGRYLSDKTTYLEHYLNELCEYNEPVPSESPTYD